MKALLLMALAGLMIAVPASAQDACPEGQTETPEGCSQQAWVDDCPPDMMCAAAVEEPAENGTANGDDRSPGDAPDEACPDYQQNTSEGCPRQAWIDDCPPDMMCVATVEEPVENGTYQDDGPTYGDCGGEVCAYDTPVDSGTEYPQAPDFSTCMDGADPGEDCDDAIYYMKPGGDTGAEADPASDDVSAKGKDASLGVHVLAGLALVAGAMMVRRRA